MSSFRRAYSGGSAKDAAERAQRQAEPELKKDVDYTNYEEGIYIGYRYFDTFNKPVAYPFGFGLSYTTFSYELLHSGITGNKCVVEVKVTNTGKVAGKEVIQVYVKAPKGSMDKPSKELKAFGKTRTLRPGESQVLKLEWDTMSMASFNEKKSAWELAKGNYQFLVSTSSKDVKATATHKVAKQRLDAVNNVLKPVEKVPVSALVVRK
jgi:beta-glucosidase